MYFYQIMKNRLSGLFFLMLTVCANAQVTFPYNGVMPKDVTSVAFLHATIIVDFQTRIDDATLLIERGKVVSVGKNLALPDNVVRVDLKGKFIYPSFIDLYSDCGIASQMPTTEMKRGEHKIPEAVAEKGAFGWNPAIHPEVNAADLFSMKQEVLDEYRKLGFGAVLTHMQDGIVRGSAAFVCLNENPNLALLQSRSAAFFSFNKGTSSMQYPSSLMGSIALLRQTWYDAQWYKAGGDRVERNRSLEAFNENLSLPAIFETGDKWNLFRADKVGDEFGVQFILKTGGNEYQRMNELKASKASLIVPLNFPDAYDVSDPFLTRLVSLDEMKHWELAPSNCAMLAKEKIQFAITSANLNDRSVFLKNLRKAVKRGLSEQDALKALTITPASLIRADREVGRLQPGMWANFFIASKNIFEEDAIIQENWVQGEQYVFEFPRNEIAGVYQLKLPNGQYDLTVKSDGNKTKSEISIINSSKDSEGFFKWDTLKYNVNIAVVNELLTIHFDANDSLYKGSLRLAGDIGDTKTSWSGKGQTSSGTWFSWTAARTGDAMEKPKDKKKNDSTESVGDVIFPFTAYGNREIPKQENVLIKNATVWTSESEGKLENHDVLLMNGKIAALGKSLDASSYAGVKVIDATGKHVTAGIIDEHSHIALAGVNEGAQASSAEVQQAHVVYPEDINIYRQLSGGVTASQLLHGSANPIGGQSAIVKLRWGVSADDMIIKGAPGFIKFALGENVKQSNWQNDGTRFPQTRMGVEQIYYDHFIRAREYGDAIKRNSTSVSPKGKITVSAQPFRRDLELETLNEILEHKRFVTCHSYVQSEINMLMHVADSLNFTLNTFTHILEGYKVADKMKAHGSGASTFSDWWAYKFEVKDAIPYNAALLYNEGITVAINSDDAEMGRRLNQEAAKSVKYGGVSEEEALKMVTINPAKLLLIDKQTGSIKTGKDADVVIWSDHPLSIYARVENTFVDGVCYFDLKKDETMQQWIATERARIIQKMLAAKQGGDDTQQPSYKAKKHFHCDTLDQSSEGVSFR